MTGAVAAWHLAAWGRHRVSFPMAVLMQLADNAPGVPGSRRARRGATAAVAAGPAEAVISEAVAPREVGRFRQHSRGGSRP
jgi:hypothetical protein